MKRIIFYSIALCSLLYSDATEKDVFVEKYISDKETYQRNQNVADEYRKNLSKDVSIKEISKKERKDIDITIEANKHNIEANKISQNVNNDIKSIEFQKKIEANKDYIFKDKDLNFDEKMGNYKKEIAPEKKLNYKNKSWQPKRKLNGKDCAIDLPD